MRARAIGNQLGALAGFCGALIWAGLAAAADGTPNWVGCVAMTLLALGLLWAFLADLDRQRWTAAIVRGAEEHLARAAEVER